MKKSLFTIAFFISISTFSNAQSPYLKETAQLHPTKLAWWQDARFGLFVHWGPVTLSGIEISWARNKYGAEKYDALYKRFNPVKFNADEWISIAQSAGMKYIIFIAKHHDGFCNWDTKTTDYSIMNAPFKRDICKELAAAAHKAGMPIGWYFSQADWVDKDCRNPQTNDVFVKRSKEQLTELLTNYGKISFLWFDYEGSPSPQQPKEMYELAEKLQPGIVVNNRLEVFNVDESHSMIGNFGDYATPENFVAGYGSIPWETCTNLGHQWSWKWNDTPRDIKESATTLLRCVGGNGNLLLNVGPDSLGQFPANFVDRLHELGRWIKPRAASVYGTKGGPYTPATDYVCTSKGNFVFLQIINLKGDTVTLPALPSKILSAKFVDGQTAEFIQNKKFLKLIVPANYKDRIATTITLTIDKPASELPLIIPFGTSGSLAYGKKSSASSSMGQFLHDPNSAFDDNPGTSWKMGRKADANFDFYYGKRLSDRSEEMKPLYADKGWLEVDLGKPQKVSRIILSEQKYYGISQIQQFEVQYLKGKNWITIAKGEEMNDWKQDITAVKAQKFRLVILKKDGFVGIKEFQLLAQDKK